jgi:predicted  nucleic acid-binding Zn-ribbon protein
MTSVSQTVALIQYCSQESAECKGENAERDLEQASDTRQEMKVKIEEAEARAAELEVELADASDMDGWDQFCSFCFGSDNGVSDIGDDIARNAAEMEKANNELTVIEQESQGMMEDIQETQASLEETYQGSEEILQGEQQGDWQALA